MSSAKGDRPEIIWPFAGQERKVLLHSCCAVCSGEIIAALLASGIKPTVFFYNPNIYPPAEYLRRKEAVVAFAKKNNVDILEDDYDPDAWLTHMRGFEQEKEGGERCRRCFQLRLQAAARCAFDKGFSVFTSTLGISRYKNFELISLYGREAAQAFTHLIYWDHNWRKKGGSERMYAIARAEHFYAQDYCGCKFSIR